MILKHKFERLEIDDSIMMIPVGDVSDKSKFVLRLNDSAAKICEALNEDMTEDELITKLSKEYAVSEVLISKMIKDFIKELKDNDLVE